MIDVYDFMYLFIEDTQPFRIYDLSVKESRIVWCGTIDELPLNLANEMVRSVDSINYSPTKCITINIDSDLD